MLADGTAVSHRAAAALRELSGCEPGILEVTVPRGRRWAYQQDVVVHWLLPLRSADIAFVGAIPVTSVARTLIDIASVAPSDTVEEALDEELLHAELSCDALCFLRDAAPNTREFHYGVSSAMVPS